MIKSTDALILDTSVVSKCNANVNAPECNALFNKCHTCRMSVMKKDSRKEQWIAKDYSPNNHSKKTSKYKNCKLVTNLEVSYENKAYDVKVNGDNIEHIEGDNVSIYWQCNENKVKINEKYYDVSTQTVSKITHEFPLKERNGHTNDFNRFVSEVNFNNGQYQVKVNGEIVKTDKGNDVDLRCDGKSILVNGIEMSDKNHS